MEKICIPIRLANERIIYETFHQTDDVWDVETGTPVVAKIEYL